MFSWWPSGSGATCTLEAYQAQLLLVAGNPETPAAPLWRRVGPQEIKASTPK